MGECVSNAVAPPRILLTTTSFQDTPGRHHDLLAETGWEIVTARGPLSEADTLAAVGEVDGYICGDGAITRGVLEKARPRLKVLSKYGIGVDKIDVAACTEMGLPLLFTPGVNHTTVAEHTFLLLLALEKHLLFHCDSTRAGGWKRKTGHEILGKRIGIVGLGYVGLPLARAVHRAGYPVLGYDVDPAKITALEGGAGSLCFATGMAATVLVRLAVLTGRDRYRQAAERAIAAVAPLAKRSATAASQTLLALDLLLGPIKELVVVADGDDAAMNVAVQPLRLQFRPRGVLAVRLRAEAAGPRPLDHLFADRPGEAGAVVLYECVDGACAAPQQL